MVGEFSRWQRRSGRAQSAAADAGHAAAGPAYQDRYLGGGTLTPDISTGDYSTSDTTGLARSIRVDAVGSVLQGEGANTQPATHEYGIVTDAQWDTVSYGAWSAEAAGRIGGGYEPQRR